MHTRNKVSDPHDLLLLSERYKEAEKDAIKGSTFCAMYHIYHVG